MSKKTLITVLVGALVASALIVGPAEAKKKKKKTPPPAACAAYTPGELGAKAPTLTITDAATAAAPAVHKFSLGPNPTEGASESRFPTPTETINVQVDAAAASAGLYVTFKFPTRRDYDLYARWPNGNEAASSHGFQPTIEATMKDPVFGLQPSNTDGNHAGESKADSENLVGVITPDCGGYTLQMKNYFGEGGNFEAHIWLGEGKTEPKPEAGEEPAE